MASWERAALWIIATGVIVAGLYWLREPLTQFALAVILWLTIDALKVGILRWATFVPKPLALPIALVLVLGLTTLIFLVVADNVGAMAADSKNYGARLDAVVVQLYQALGLTTPAPTVQQMLSQANPGVIVGNIGAALQAIASDTVFILIFLGFLFPAANVMSKKLDLIFPDPVRREQSRRVTASIRVSMERYLWVQTVVSLVTTLLTYLTLRVIGLDHALFWSFLIFFLNYIPTIGSIVAVLLPTAFALIQFPGLGQVALVAAGVGVWQFVIGNFLAPRMTGDSLNLSALIVLLALAIWGTIWGIAGAFLAAPLTVMLMIVLAQFPSTRWIAILLSADGKPTHGETPLHISESGSF
jgi:AI-2 transport protein TqsA